jgi:hypothetical protein
VCAVTNVKINARSWIVGGLDWSAREKKGANRQYQLTKLPLNENKSIKCLSLNALDQLQLLEH